MEPINKESVKKRTTIKNNSHKTGYAAERKATKRTEAEARQKEYNKLSLDDKIAKQEAFGFKGKQLAKLKKAKNELN